MRGALRLQRGLELAQPALELPRARLGVAAHRRELGAHAGQLLADRRELALPRSEPLAGCGMTAALGGEVAAGDLELCPRLGLAPADRGRVGSRTLRGERDLLSGLLARGGRLRGAGLGGRERLDELALTQRKLCLQPARPPLVLAEARERNRVGSPQQLAPAQPVPLLAELLAQPLDRRERLGERRLRWVRRRGRERARHE